MKKLVSYIVLFCLLLSVSSTRAEEQDYAVLLPTLEFGISTDEVIAAEKLNKMHIEWDESKLYYTQKKFLNGKHKALYTFENNKLIRYRYIIDEIQDVNPKSAGEFLDFYRKIVSYYEKSLQSDADFRLSFKDLQSFDIYHNALPAALENNVVYFYTYFETDDTLVDITLHNDDEKFIVSLEFIPKP